MHELRVHLADDGADEEHLDMLVDHLRAELLLLDVEGVTHAAGSGVPDGARSVEIAAVGSLVVSLRQSAQVLGGVITAAWRWVSRPGSSGRTVRLELDGDVLELSAASTADQQRLIELFVDRHAEEPG